MAYLKITSLRSLDLRVEGKVYVLVMILALMRRSVRMEEMQVIKDTFESSRKQGTPRMEVEGFKVAFVDGNVRV